MTNTEGLPPLTLAARRIQYLEKQNRKLNDRLNRFRNVTPGRKRLYSLGRIAATLEYEADENEKRADERDQEDPVQVQVARIERLYVTATREDALFLHRLEWDFEQLIDVLYPPKQPRYPVWKRP